MNKAWKENNLLKENEYDKEWSGVLIHYKTGKKAKTELKARTLNDLKKKASETKPMTENGKKIYEWMQAHKAEMSNMFTSKEIAEALFVSGRSVAGAMRKLVNDGLVTKTGTNPIQYSLNPMIVESSVDN